MKSLWFVLAAGVAAGVSSSALGEAGVDLDSATGSYADALLADAASRSSLLDGVGGAGYKGKFFITDGGPNTFEFGSLWQFRYQLNRRDNVTPSDDETTMGFQLRKVELNFSGTYFDPRFGYKIQPEIKSDGSMSLADAYGTVKLENGVTLQYGQFKLPFLHEELVSSSAGLTMERSVFNQVFTLERSQGLQVEFSEDVYRFLVALSDGRKALNTPFDSASEADFALTARGEYRWGKADFKRLGDFVSWRGSEYGGAAGLAAHYESGGSSNATIDRTITSVTADAQAEGDGWGAYAAFVWRSTDPDGGTSTDDMGVLVQGNIFMTDQVEAFARYDVVIPDDAGGADNFSTLTGGVNYYISPSSQAAKLTVDLIYFLDKQGNTGGVVGTSSNQALLADTEGGQFALRGQIQFKY